jgi:hypothetical protein
MRSKINGLLLIFLLCIHLVATTTISINLKKGDKDKKDKKDKDDKKEKDDKKDNEVDKQKKKDKKRDDNEDVKDKKNKNKQDDDEDKNTKKGVKKEKDEEGKNNKHKEKEDKKAEKEREKAEKEAEKERKKSEKEAEKRQKEEEKAAKESDKSKNSNDKNINIPEKSSPTSVNTSSQSSSNVQKVLSTNPLFLFLVGFVENLGGIPGIVNSCVPDSWKTGSFTTSTSDLEDGWENLNSGFRDIIKNIGSSVSGLCTIKSLISPFMSGGKSFIQKKSTLKSHLIKKGFFGIPFVDDVADFISDSAKEVKKTVDKVTKPVKDVIKPIEKFVPNPISPLPGLSPLNLNLLNLFKDAYGIFLKAFRAIVIDKNFLNSINIFQCLTNTGKFAVNMASVIMGIYRKIQLISAALAAGGAPVVIPLIDIMINLICHWQDFVSASNSLSVAIKTKDKSEKWDALGRFFGSLSRIIATA